MLERQNIGAGEMTLWLRAHTTYRGPELGSQHPCQTAHTFSNKATSPPTGPHPLILSKQSNNWETNIQICEPMGAFLSKPPQGCMVSSLPSPFLSLIRSKLITTLARICKPWLKVLTYPRAQRAGSSIIELGGILLGFLESQPQCPAHLSNFLV